MPKKSDTKAKKVTTTIKMTPFAAGYIKDLAEQAELSQGLIVQILVEMLILNVGGARERGFVDDETETPDIELHAILTAHYAGLIDESEVERSIALGDAMHGVRADLRMRGLEKLLNERRDELQPAWEAARERRRKERAEHPVKLDAADRAAYEMLQADRSAKVN